MGTTPAQADNGPHISLAITQATSGVFVSQVGAGKCAGCHRAHTAQASYLLVQAQPALCYTCHDGSSVATNVKGGVDANTGAALRGGGFVTAAIDTAHGSKDLLSQSTHGWSASNQNIPVLSSPVAVTSSHNITGIGTSTMWGNGPISATANAGTAVTLECGSCHDPHGNGNYRILRPVPNDSGAAAPGVTINDVPATLARVYTTTNYWLSGDTSVPNTTVGATAGVDGYIQNVSAWCTTCHTRYLAPSQSYKTPNTDPTTGAVDATFMYRHRSDAVNKEAGAANCITCHVAHGSNAAMTGSAATKVAMPDGTIPPLVTTGGTAAAPITSGDSRLLRVDNRGICLMCHNV